MSGVLGDANVAPSVSPSRTATVDRRVRFGSFAGGPWSQKPMTMRLPQLYLPLTEPLYDSRDARLLLLALLLSLVLAGEAGAAEIVLPDNEGRFDSLRPPCRRHEHHDWGTALPAGSAAPGRRSQRSTSTSSTWDELRRTSRPRSRQYLLARRHRSSRDQTDPNDDAHTVVDQYGHHLDQLDTVNGARQTERDAGLVDGTTRAWSGSSGLTASRPPPFGW